MGREGALESDPDGNPHSLLPGQAGQASISLLWALGLLLSNTGEDILCRLPGELCDVRMHEWVVMLAQSGPTASVSPFIL